VRLIGYTDPFSARAGDRVEFMVSSSSAYEARIVRLIHGDLDPRGPGLKVQPCDVALEGGGRHAGREQLLRTGSYVEVDDDIGSLASLDSFTLHVLVYPTTPSKGAQGLMTCWAQEAGAGYGLFVGADGDVELRLGEWRLGTGRPLQPGRWYAASGRYDAATGVAAVDQAPLVGWSSDAPRVGAEAQTGAAARAPAATSFVLAGADRAPELCFNGKLEAPIVAGEALTDAELLELADRPIASVRGLVAAWDLGGDHASAIARDVGPHGLHGRVVNAPTRAVTGARWSGEELDFRRAPEHYGAMHFHDDDLEDAGWSPDFALVIPEAMRSGFYAAHLVAENGGEDWVPFVVSVTKTGARADVVLLAPTLSYLAYANEHMVADPERSARSGIAYDEYLASGTDYEQGLFRYIVDNRLHSTYDAHSDRTGVCYASSRRPLANVRPTYNKPSQHFRIPHQLGADLYLVDWLEARGIECDVISDNVLHEDGAEALAPYRVVMTGTHPEYTSESMVVALERHLEGGGRLMYMGGNGFYWITSIDPSRPHLIEIRRGESGTRTWNAFPGENHHSTTGEPGGIWRSRGRPPQRLVAIGFTAQGADEGRPYRRSPASHHPDVAFIFEGIDDELIGDFGIYMDAAGGWEVDRYDTHLGSPFHAMVLATATGFSDTYQHAIEEVLDGTNPAEGGTVSPLVRADLVYCAFASGGAVLSTGSITWAGSLSHDGYRNNVSRLTENVLRAFATVDPLPGQPRREPTR
jgi:N,N-dimethylformamidase beta subunit-like protein